MKVKLEVTEISSDKQEELAEIIEFVIEHILDDAKTVQLDFGDEKCLVTIR